MRRLWLILFLALASVAYAQDDGGEKPGFFDRLFGTDEASNDEEQGTLLERLIQDNLSGAGRAVRVEGFSGALSGKATMDRLTIADDQGIWLTLTDATLDWSRAALFSGRLEVAELSAVSIELPRLPGPSNTGDAPSPETSGFKLPELPVSVEIGRIAAETVEIGAPVVGVAASVSLDGSLSLAGGDGAAKLEIQRLDGGGGLSLDAGFANETELLRLDLSLAEQDGGLLATLIGLPGRPAVAFSVRGEAPLSEFVADIALETDGEERLAGTVRIGQTDEARTIAAQIGGDLAPVFAPQYRDFFGDRIALDASALLFGDGRIEVPGFALTARELQLEGNVQLGADKLPRLIEVMGRIAPESGPDVLLPLGEVETRITSADLSVMFDAETSEDWSGRVVVAGLDRSDVGADQIALTGTGRIRQGQANQVTAALDFAVEGFESGIEGLAEAVGRDLTGEASITRTEGGPVEISGLRLAGASLSLEGEASVGAELRTKGKLSVDADRIADFSALAGRELSGSASLDTDFTYAPIGGAFEVAAKGRTRDVTLSDNYADPLLQGVSELDLTAARDERGLRVDIRRLVNQAARVTGVFNLRSGGSTATADVTLTDVSLVLPEIEGPASLILTGAEDPERDWRFTADFEAAGLDASATGKVSGLYDENPNFSGRLSADARDLAALSRIAGRSLGGQVKLTARGSANRDLSLVALDLSAVGNGLSVGDTELDRLLAGSFTAEVEATRGGETISVTKLDVASDTLRLSGAGTMIEENARIDLTASLSDISPLSELAKRDLAGQVDLTAKGDFTTDLARGDIIATASGNGLSIGDTQLDRLLAGPFSAAVAARRDSEVIEVTRLDVSTDAVRADGSGRLEGDEATVDLTASISDLAPLSELAKRPLTGSLDLVADGSFTTDLSSADMRAEVSGSGLSIGQTEADRILAGALSAKLSAMRDGDVIRIGEFDFATDLLTARASGSLAEDNSKLAVETRLADIASFVEGFAGPLAIDGTIGRGASGRLDLNLDATGPGGAQASVTGGLAEDMTTADLEIDGTAPLGLVNRFLKPFSIAGIADFDLRLDGPLALESLSGRVATSGSRLAAPTLNTAFTDIGGSLSLSSGGATLDLSTAVQGSGRIAITGPLALAAPFAANLDIALDRVAVTDPRFFETSVSGQLGVDGPLAGGARIGGNLTLGQTDIRIPSSGFAGAGDIPEITHINEPPPVRGTRRRAGLLDSRNGDNGNGSSGPVYPLDIAIAAPNRIFVRGRGLDSEFGGRLRVTGTSRDVVPIGAFELIRGRLDILGRRLALDEARITLQGGLIPFLRIRATTDAEGYRVGVEITGPADDPEIRFTSTPQLPQEEVVARLIFGRGIETLSPLQAARLAIAVRTLSGQGGEGVVDKIRGGAGLADLDVTTTEDGNAAVRAGAYLGENVYTDVTVDSAGETTLQLNLDITPSLTARGGVSNDGETSLGIFFERDY